MQGTGLSPRLPGHDYNNSDHTFSDDSDPVDATRTFVTTRRKFREGFDIAQIIATRERRRVVADTMVQPEDIYAGRTWPDALSSARSNFDTHGFTVHPLFTVLPPDHEPRQTGVPLRALLPRGLEGILGPAWVSAPIGTPCRCCACNLACRTRVTRPVSSRRRLRLVAGVSGRSTWRPFRASCRPWASSTQTMSGRTRFPSLMPF